MEPKFLIAGDSAISVQLGDAISLEINQQVRMLCTSLEQDPIDGVMEVVPTYASLMIHYKPEVIRYESLVEMLKRRVNYMRPTEHAKRKITEIPICYGGELGPDFDDCAAIENVSAEELIRMHSEPEYYVYMLGFAPGHAYMARFNYPFHFKRRETPRLKIAARSIVVQENLSNLIPFEQPCGWNIIGATPLNICDYSKEEPFLVHSGEWARYIPVSYRDYQLIRSDVEKGSFQVKTYERTVE